MRVRSLCLTAVAALVPALTATQTFAGPAYAGKMRFDSILAGNSSAGEFAWTNVSLTFTPEGQGDASRGLGPSQFITFCVEKHEHISYGQTAHAFINTESVNTGIPLKAETAFLYTQFIKGTLAGYTYNDDDSALSLQRAIWCLQEQIASVDGDTQAQAWMDLANNEVNLVNGGTWGDTIGNVRILNTWTSVSGGNPAGSALQDQLVMIPLPAPVWMAGLGMLGVVGGSAYRRRGRAIVDNL